MANDELIVKVWNMKFPTGTMKLTALAICRLSQARGFCWASRQYLAQITDQSTKTIARHITEMEKKGWIRVVQRFKKKGGGRTTDYLCLTLPAVMLEENKVPQNVQENLPGALMGDDEMMTTIDDIVTGQSVPADEKDGANQQSGHSEEAPLDTVGGTPPTQSPPNDDSNDDSKGKSDTHSDEGDGDGLTKEVKARVKRMAEAIWDAALKPGRTRSSKAKLEAGIIAAHNRGHSLEDILKGTLGYLTGHDATKDEGEYQKGLHLIMSNEIFLTWLEDGPDTLPPGVIDGEEAPAKAHEGDPRLGTLERPTREAQRLWVASYANGMAWASERGPLPGELGCRVEPHIQREYGFEPATLDPVSDGEGETSTPDGEEAPAPATEPEPQPEPEEEDIDPDALI